MLSQHEQIKNIVTIATNTNFIQMTGIYIVHSYPPPPPHQRSILHFIPPLLYENHMTKNVYFCGPESYD